MQNNIIDLLGLKDRDIRVNVTKSSPSSVEVTVDEVHLKISRYCNYALVIQDFITGDPIDLVADRKKQTTEPYFQGIPLKERAKVKYLITDMYRPFESYVSSYFPNAIHIVDSFHVIQLIVRHILGYIRRKQRELDERDRARHERIEQDIRQRFFFSQRSRAAVKANPKPLEEVMFKTDIKRGPYVKKAYRSESNY